MKFEGVQFNYQSICTPRAIEAHKIVVEAEKAKIETQKAMAAAAKQEELRRIEEKKLALAEKFRPAVEESNIIWPILVPLVTAATSGTFAAIARHIKDDFICAGSYPAYVVATAMRNIPSYRNIPYLKFNDIDIYYGCFGNGEVKRIDCV